MQDNWQEDENFWDEAWKDMEGRLDERRRVPAWWWLGFAAVLLVGFFYGTSFRNTAPAEDDLREVIEEKGKQVKQPVVAARVPVVEAGAANAIQQNLTEIPVPTLLSYPASVSATSPEVSQPIQVAAPTTVPTTALETTPRSTALATALLPSLDFRVRRHDTTALAATAVRVPLAKEPSPHHFFASAEATPATNLNTAGYGLSVGRNWRFGKFGLPLSFGFSRLDHEVTGLNESALNTAFGLGNPNGTPVLVNDFEVNDVTATEGEARPVRTDQLWLETGLGYALLPRLTLHTDFRFGYVIGGREPILFVEDDQGRNPHPVFGGAFRNVLDNKESTDRAGPDASLNGEANKQILDRWRFAASVGADYRFFGKWSAGLHYQRELNKLYPDGPYETHQNRFRIRLLYAF